MTSLGLNHFYHVEGGYLRGVFKHFGKSKFKLVNKMIGQNVLERPTVDRLTKLNAEE